VVHTSAGRLERLAFDVLSRKPLWQARFSDLILSKGHHTPTM
jgi:hypothetical protein